MGENETLEQYIERRNKSQSGMSKLTAEGRNFLEKEGIAFTKSGSIFSPGLTRDTYMTVEDADKHLMSEKQRLQAVDKEKTELRKKLQVENEAAYRKQMAEMKRAEIAQRQQSQRRLPHPADPDYDPFKLTPGYRPQDSGKLAQWLKIQRESGTAHNGTSLEKKEGRERLYNEEKMATQYNANPFASHIEYPRTFHKMAVTAYSPDSVFINEKEVIGSIIITPTRYYHWNVTTFEDITLKSLALVLHMYPAPEILFLGTGRNLYFVDEEIRVALMKKGCALHCMTTRDATAYFGTVLTHQKHVVCACLANMPTNSYGRECFGDFVDNDYFSLSDTAQGIPPNRQFNPCLYRQNKVAEKYRHLQGTGIGPQYHITSKGLMVRPGTSGTKLRPLIEPGEEIDWEKLPSYYHWYPKETVHDYIENNTWRELAPQVHQLERSSAARRGDVSQFSIEGVREQEKNPPQPEVEIMPWDSKSIPAFVWPFERDEREITVSDPKTGRLVGMNKDTFEKWKTMMKARKEGKTPEVEVEYDQENIVADKRGKLYDTSRMRYVPLYYGRFHPKRPSKTGRGHLRFMP